MNKVTFNFVEERTWIGKYEIASYGKQQGDRKFGYLDDSCSFCLTKYLPTDELIVLPCSHGLHKYCFTAWEKNICPFDSAPADRIVKRILFSRYSLTFTEQTSGIFQYLETNQEKIKKFLQGGIQSVQNLFPKNNQKILNKPEVSHFFGSLIEYFFQKLIDIYSYNDNIPNGYLSRFIQNLLDRVEQIYSDSHSDRDYFKFKKNLEEKLSSTISLELLLVDLFAHWGIPIHDQGIHNLIIFMDQLIKTFVNRPKFIEMAEMADRRFFTKHFKIIRKLPNEKTQISYLFSMEPDVLNRLNRLNQGDGPTSILIRKNIQKIEKTKALSDWIYGKLSIVAKGILVGCVLSYSVISYANSFPDYDLTE